MKSLVLGWVVVGCLVWFSSSASSAVVSADDITVTARPIAADELVKFERAPAAVQLVDCYRGRGGGRYSYGRGYGGYGGYGGGYYAPVPRYRSAYRPVPYPVYGGYGYRGLGYPGYGGYGGYGYGGRGGFGLYIGF